MYFNLLKKLSNLDRTHNSEGTRIGYNLLNKFYKGSRLINFKIPNQVNHWKMIPYWECKKAELRNSKNKIIVSKKDNNLSVFSFSPKVHKTISYNELINHTATDKKRPNSTIFHFRNQYRHWKPEWGFSIPYNKLKKLNKNEKFKVIIESKFYKNKGFVQSDYLKKGKIKDTYMFMGHFDHPNQTNDGLAGVIAAYETIKRLKKIKTKFTYLAFASIEITGSIYYLEKFKSMVKNIKEGIFVTLSGIKSEIAYQKTYFENSLMDKIIDNIFIHKNNKKFIFKHRELIGNDENIFDSVGYNIPMGTVLRWPFKEYHTDKDNIKITNKDKIEEIISLNLKVVFILENNFRFKAKYKGVPCLSSEKINLYLDPTTMSKKRNKVDKNLLQSILVDLDRHEKIYIKNNLNLMYGLMNHSIRMATGDFTILELSEKSNLPFKLVYNYLEKLKEKKLIHFF